MGIVPIWGYQMIVAFALAHFFRLNKTVVILASNISIPPMIPFILYGSVRTGAFILRQPFALTLQTVTFEMVKHTLAQYLIGSVVFAAGIGILGCLFTFVGLKIPRRNF